MICAVMSGNGFRTAGTKTIMGLLLTEAHGKTETAPIVSLVGEAGTALPIPAAQLPVSAVNLRNI